MTIACMLWNNGYKHKDLTLAARKRLARNVDQLLRNVDQLPAYPDQFGADLVQLQTALLVTGVQLLAEVHS